MAVQVLVGQGGTSKGGLKYTWAGAADLSVDHSWTWPVGPSLYLVQLWFAGTSVVLGNTGTFGLKAQISALHTIAQGESLRLWNGISGGLNADLPLGTTSIIGGDDFERPAWRAYQGNSSAVAGISHAVGFCDSFSLLYDAAGAGQGSLTGLTVYMQEVSPFMFAGM